MAVAGRDAAAVVDLDQIAVAAAVPASAKDGAVGGCIDRRAVRARRGRCQGASRRRAAERIGADAVAAGESGGLDRLVRRNGDCARRKLSSFFQLVNSCLKVGSALPSNGPPTAGLGGSPALRSAVEAERRSSVDLSMFSLFESCGQGAIWLARSIVATRRSVSAVELGATWAAISAWRWSSRFGHRSCDGSGREDAGDGVAGPANQGKRTAKARIDDGSGQAELTASLLSVMHEKIAIPEKAGRGRQNCRS